MFAFWGMNKKGGCCFNRKYKYILLDKYLAVADEGSWNTKRYRAWRACRKKKKDRLTYFDRWKYKQWEDAFSGETSKSCSLFHQGGLLCLPAQFQRKI